MPSDVILYTDLPGVKLVNRGKVRDIYDVGDSLLIIATDRISAFDVVMPNGIPDKGKVLTALSLFWFEFLRDVTPNHLIETDVSRFPAPLPSFADQLAGRSMLVTKADVIPVECLVRGYAALGGAGWKEYHEKGTISGIALPPDLIEGQKLPTTIFTPTTKAQSGLHDENITNEQAIDIIGEDLFNEIRSRSIAIYTFAEKFARERGLIISDTKFEFGLRKGSRNPADVLLIDEALTPDSSRFWDLAAYVPGQPQVSFDKQFLREYLKKIGWNQQPPAPQLPDEIIAGTRSRYLEAYERICGHPLVTAGG
jgi:phosphoribosylaminoimidazole-succinocarboxamide synthase